MKFAIKTALFGLLLGICLLFTPLAEAQEKTILDLSEVKWNEKTFYYDNTEKVVELINVPKEIHVQYTNNKKTKLGAYTAHAEFDYDREIYEVVHFDFSILKNYQWEIIQGRYDLSLMRFNDRTILEDGSTHSIFVENLPAGLQVSYSDNNAQSLPGRYVITATFEGNPYFEKVPTKQATLTIRRKRLWTEEKDSYLLSDGWGFAPETSFHCSWNSIEPYSDLDLTKIGAYREVKASFALDLQIQDEATILDHSVKAKIKLNDELTSLKDLAVYDYGSGQLVNMVSSREDEYLVFNVSSLSNEYLIIGTRNTYTANGSWKAFLIFGMCLLFIVTLLIIRFIYKKRKGI